MPESVSKGKILSMSPEVIFPTEFPPFLTVGLPLIKPVRTLPNSQQDMSRSPLLTHNPEDPTLVSVCQESYFISVVSKAKLPASQKDRQRWKYPSLKLKQPFPHTTERHLLSSLSVICHPRELRSEL